VALSAEELSLRGRAGAFKQHAMYDVRETTKPARDAQFAKLEAEVDPDGVLSPEERIRRAIALRRSRMQVLALRSAKVRRERARL
jgi:hypothetical protein